MARPVWTPTDAQRRQAETMAAYGIPEANIARVLGVSKPTLRKHCGTELDTGATRATQRSLTFCSTEFAAAPANRHSKTSAPASRPRSGEEIDLAAAEHVGAAVVAHLPLESLHINQTREPLVRGAAHPLAVGLH